MNVFRTPLTALLGVMLCASVDAQEERPKRDRPHAEGRERGPGPGPGKRPRTPGRHMAERFMETYDTNKDGKVSFEEFGAAEKTAVLQEEGKRRLFNHLDKNKDGAITAQELPKGGSFDPSRRGDQNGDGKISFEEFKNNERVKGSPEDRQRAIFNRMDFDKDGFLTAKDFRRPRRGPGFDRAELQKLDANGDSSLSFEEWAKHPRHKELSQEELKKRFDWLDRNNDGALNEKDREGRGPGPGPGGPRRKQGQGPPPAK